MTGRGSLAGQYPGSSAGCGLPDPARAAAADPCGICERGGALLREQGMWAPGCTVVGRYPGSSRSDPLLPLAPRVRPLGRRSRAAVQTTVPPAGAQWRLSAPCTSVCLHLRIERLPFGPHQERLVLACVVWTEIRS